MAHYWYNLLAKKFQFKNIMKPINKYIIVYLMCLISFDLLFSKSISSYRKDFNNAIVRSHDLRGVESLSKLSILLNKFRKDNPKLEDDTYNNRAISLYLDIWEIKIKFYLAKSMNLLIFLMN